MLTYDVLNSHSSLVNEYFLHVYPFPSLVTLFHRILDNLDSSENSCKEKKKILKYVVSDKEEYHKCHRANVLPQLKGLSDF